jgi:lipid II:glycine glycyltransferase (peptidoglycan interpeptide bridge formation enzyme)
MNIPFTQTKEYLSWHSTIGEKTFYKEFFDNKTGELCAIVASFILELRVGKVLYVPYGPYHTPLLCKERPGEVEKIKKEILEYLFNLAKKENCVFVRLENSFFSKNENKKKENFGKNFSSLTVIRPPKKSFAKEGVFQPRVEWWLDLKENEENIYNNFHKDHRYSIRRAEKENIQVEIVKENLHNHFENFWKILKETSERDGFHLYEQEYYQAIFQNSQNKFLVFTKDNEKYLSVALVVVSDKVANLVYAGSQTEGREKGFNHLMQWEAIKQAKVLGCDFYNFGGIYEKGYGKPGLAGVTNFKKRFSGFAQFHGDFVDMPVKRFKYLLYLAYKMLK